VSNFLSHSLVFGLAVGAGASLLSSGAAHAETAANRVIEEVVVTARKREERLV